MFNRLKNSLEEVKLYYGNAVVKTFTDFSLEINKLLIDRDFFDDQFFEDFEEKLIELDIVPNLAIILTEKLQVKIYNQRVSKEKLQVAIYETINNTVKLKSDKLTVQEKQLNVWLIVGVNGVGKTTTISKLTNLNLKDKPLLVAADTFRAGAIEQLSLWSEKLGVDIIKTYSGHAPSAVIYKAMEKSIEEKRKLVICDTAGRLHNKSDLMNELAKIHQIIYKQTSNEVKLKTVLVLDGTAGKNTLEQARVFNEITDLDGVIITKLDSGGKAGMIINISYELNLPVYYLTTGESVDQIKEFDTTSYLESLFGNHENS